MRSNLTCVSEVSSTNPVDRVLSFDTKEAVEVDLEKAFQLIDRVLPFEACLYHQILPLLLEDNYLYLGMVALDDTTALEYVRRLVSFMNYTLVPRHISSKAHYAALSAYLNHTQDQQRTLPDRQPNDVVSSLTQGTAKGMTVANSHTKATLILDNLDEADKTVVGASDLHAKATLVIDSPDELDWGVHPTLAKPSPAEVALELQKAKVAPAPPPNEGFTPANALPTLEVSTQYLNSPIERLAQLPPDQLLQELLGRILLEGIGRLYFERQANYGRILWSQNGVLQSVLNQVPLTIFQGLLSELKRLTSLPDAPIQQVRQVEIERLCQKNRVLLRLRIMPKTHGEEATLQVLRGAALKFYQQQQLTSLSRDALSIAKDLQKKLGEIHDRATSSTQLSPNASAVMPTLNQVLQIVEQQLVDLKDLNQEQS
jgi:type II secretory ATPase GspE/PulE/Tfp pilus assembly ATPase PilB-like protein